MLRVLSIPSAHPYVRHALPARVDGGYPAVPDSPGVVEAPPAPGAAAARLPDPLPEGGGEPGVWWPARALDPAWVREHAEGVDVVHLHFGFEGRTPDQLTRWVDELDRLGLPLVLTVHDLANPHLLDQDAHAAALARLVPRAAQVLTLTDGAADEVARRFGRRPRVVPHPQIVDDAGILAADAARPTGTIGIHLGALRAGTDPRAWLPRLVRAAAAAGLGLDVVAADGLCDTTDPARRAVLDGVRSALGDGVPGPGLRFGPRLPDDDLHAWVAGLDVAVLPYRHGTHSGWLEMCWDLGTPVLAPRVGHLLDQHDDPAFVAGFDPADGDGIEVGLARLLTAGPRAWGDGPARLATRRDQLAAVRAAHEDVYRQATGR